MARERKIRECGWVECTGEAHSNAYIDHCMVCAPYWGEIPVCTECGASVKPKPRRKLGECRNGHGRFRIVRAKIERPLMHKGVTERHAATGIAGSVYGEKCHMAGCFREARRVLRLPLAAEYGGLVEAAFCVECSLALHFATEARSIRLASGEAA